MGDDRENRLVAKKRLEENFRSAGSLLAAIGDETRLHILSCMLGESCHGERVLDIAKDTNLSRPSVSHHLQILKTAGIVKTRKEGTMLYYYLTLMRSGLIPSSACSPASGNS